MYYGKADWRAWRSGALLLALVAGGCTWTVEPTSPAAWQLAGRLTVGMTRREVNKAMRWLEHRGRTYRTGRGTYEDWIYDPDKPEGKVHLRFHQGRLIGIGLNRKPATAGPGPARRR